MPLKTGARLAETIMSEPVAGGIQSAAETLLCANTGGLAPDAVLISLVAQGARIPVKPASGRCSKPGRPGAACRSRPY